MAFKNYNSGILLRALILVLLAVALAYVWIAKDWFFTPLVALIALLTSVSELIYHLNRQQRELANFLINIRQGGFTTSYNEEGPTQALFTTFNQIIQSFQDLAFKKEENYLFLQVITENLKAGIISYSTDGSVTMLNQAAKAFINKPYLSNINELENLQPLLFDRQLKLKPGQTDVIRLPQENKLNDILIQKKLIKIDEDEITILLMQNIREQIDSNELESWQKIIRVMRHEIMNSLTPIVGLSQAIHSLLKDKNRNSLTDENYEDMLESMDAISFRSTALLQFVNAYKSFSEISTIQKTEFDASVMVYRIKQLLLSNIGSKKVIINVPEEPVMMIGDEQQLEGAMLNLIKNSIEAIDEEGIINVQLSTSEGLSEIVISDNGIGVSSEQLEQIFIPFYTSKTKGSGIGLSMARKVILKHGGKIDAYNNQEGGLTVELNF